jgi:hypothetical protein
VVYNCAAFYCPNKGQLLMPIQPTDEERRVLRETLKKVINVIVEIDPEVRKEVDAAWSSLVYRFNAIENNKTKPMVAMALHLKLNDYIGDLVKKADLL